VDRRVSFCMWIRGMVRNPDTLHICAKLQVCLNAMRSAYHHHGDRACPLGALCAAVNTFSCKNMPLALTSAQVTILEINVTATVNARSSRCSEYRNK
jgi:hypothetical protein